MAETPEAHPTDPLIERLGRRASQKAAALAVKSIIDLLNETSATNFSIGARDVLANDIARRVYAARANHNQRLLGIRKSYDVLPTVYSQILEDQGQDQIVNRSDLIMAKRLRKFCGLWPVC